MTERLVYSTGESRRRRALVLLIIIFVLAACSQLLPYFEDVSAVTTPVGIFALREGALEDEWVMEHELCHWAEVQKHPVMFWLEYVVDPCAEEIRCGASPETHNACINPPFWAESHYE